MLTIVCLLIINCLHAQKIDSSYQNSYYNGRMELFESLGGQKGAIVFLGNSLTERGQWGELLPGKLVMNRGIGGDNTFGLLARLIDVLKYKPKKIFLLIGINDIARGFPVLVTVNNYRRLIGQVKAVSPATQLYIQSVLPLNEGLLKADYLKGKKDSITELNKAIKALAGDFKVTYVDLHPIVSNDKGELKEELTLDGIHLRPAAYVLWINELKRKKYL